MHADSGQTYIIMKEKVDQIETQVFHSTTAPSGSDIFELLEHGSRLPLGLLQTEHKQRYSNFKNYTHFIKQSFKEVVHPV
jgi:hypothetical protein